MRDGIESARRLVAGLVLAGLLAGLLAGCGGSPEPTSPAPPPRTGPAAGSGESPTPAHPGHADDVQPVAKPRPLRTGERRTTLRTPVAYTPSPPTGVGTDSPACQ